VVTCQACGTQNPPGAAYCKTCARKLDAETQDAVVRTRAEHTATGIRWTAVIAAAVVIVIVALVLALLVTHVI
jgi:uncharacterized membrane protein YvbJ